MARGKWSTDVVIDTFRCASGVNVEANVGRRVRINASGQAELAPVAVAWDGVIRVVNPDSVGIVSQGTVTVIATNAVTAGQGLAPAANGAVTGGARDDQSLVAIEAQPQAGQPVFARFTLRKP